jgi:hypothetical protein
MHLQLWRMALVLSMCFMPHFGHAASSNDQTNSGNIVVTVSQDIARGTIEIRWDPGKATVFRVLLDDNPGFHTPTISRTARQNTLIVDSLDAGLVPGMTYYVRVVPESSRQEVRDDSSTQFRLQVPGWPEPYLTYQYASEAWGNAGREWFHTFGGISWDGPSRLWHLDAQWAPASSGQVGPEAYYLEWAARGAINMGLMCHDLKLVDELAQFYVSYFNRFTTLGAMRAQRSSEMETWRLDGQGKDSARTLTWIEKQPSAPSRMREYLLGNSQFFHPVARLIRVITMLPGAERTPAMKRFVGMYSDLVIHDHLLRLLYEVDWDYWRAKDLPNHLVEIWKTIVRSAQPPKLSYQRAMLDRDLWLIATAAEILGANADDLELVALTPEEKMRLQMAVQTGVELFQKKKTGYRDTKTFSGKTVESASYFNGDFDDHPDNAYSGYQGSSFPTEKDKKVKLGASWDISHSYRVPVFLRSLYDNRKATGLAFPSREDIRLVINQLMYRVFQGSLEYPLFNNYFDGTNGWFEVGYHEGNFGYPPAKQCDSRDPKKPCLNTGAVQAWGLISSFDPQLTDLEHALLQLAWRDDAQADAFKERYYLYSGQSFSFHDEHGKLQYPPLLYFVISGVPEKLHGCEVH